MPDMFYERAYRWLLIVYPREYRRDYGELMVQLFRDRMRSEGNGFRGLIVWLRMIFDLIGAAFKEHKEGADMRKLTSIGIALAVVLVAGGVGIGTLLAQANGEVEVVVISEPVDTKTFSWTGSGGVAEAMQQAVEEGTIGQEAVDEIAQALEEGNALRYDFGADGIADGLRQAVEEGEISQATAGAIAQMVNQRLEGGPASLNGKVFVLSDVKTFSGTGPDGVAENLRQAVQGGTIAQGTADQIVQSLAGDGSANVWRFHGGADGVAGAVRQAVEDGVISQALADLILSSLDGVNLDSGAES